MNNWNIPEWLEEKIRIRDIKCIYCGINFNPKIKKASPTWEHIINDASIINENNIALCCCSCNASKGAKKLLSWLDSKYCKNNNINSNTIASVAKKALFKPVT